MIPIVSALIGFLLVPNPADKQPEIVHIIHWVEGLAFHKKRQTGQTLTSAEKAQAATGLILDGLNISNILDKGKVPAGLEQLIAALLAATVGAMNQDGSLVHGTSAPAPSGAPSVATN